MPEERTSWKLLAETFLAVPFSVTIKSAPSIPFLPLGIARMEVTFSSSEREMKFMTDLPRVARLPSGTSYILIWYTFPLSVKKRRSSCVLAVRKLVTKSSSLVSRSTTPTPPRFWRLYSPGLVRLMYPPLVKTSALSSSGTRSSTERTLTPPLITLVRRSSPYFVLISASSFLTTFKILAGEAKSSFISFINVCTSFNSSSTFCLSRPASFWSFISRMALAWSSESLNSFIKPARASSTVFDARISLITLSILSSALTKPSKICSLSSARARS